MTDKLKCKDCVHFVATATGGLCHAPLPWWVDHLTPGMVDPDIYASHCTAFVKQEFEADEEPRFSHGDPE